MKSKKRDPRSLEKAYVQEKEVLDEALGMHAVAFICSPPRTHLQSRAQLHQLVSGASLDAVSRISENRFSDCGGTKLKLPERSLLAQKYLIIAAQSEGGSSISLLYLLGRLRQRLIPHGTRKACYSD